MGKSTSLFVVVLLAVVTFTGVASAYPYQLYAKYKPATGNTDLIVQIGTDEPTVVPSDPLNAKLTGIYLQPKSDDLAKSELARLRELVVEVKAGDGAGAPERHVISHDVLTATAPAEQLIYTPRPLASGHPILPVVVSIYAKFTAAYLCDQERRIREKAQKPITVAGFKADGNKVSTLPHKDKSGILVFDRADAATASIGKMDPTTAGLLKPLPDKAPPTPGAAPAYSVYAYSMLFSQGLQDSDKSPIVYSFCPNVNDQIDWSAVAANLAPGAVDPEGNLVHAAQKGKLAALVVAQISSETGENIVLERHEGESLDNVYTSLTHSIALLQDLSDLDLYEVSRSRRTSVLGIVDKSSEIVLGVAQSSHFCSDMAACNTLVKNELAGSISYTDKQGKPVSKKASLESIGNAWEVLPNLADNIGDSLTITITYPIDAENSLELIKRTTQVENLGLITTFPVVSEVASAISKNASNPADITTQSSIPVSIAVSLKHGEAGHAAVTFPWMIGVNTRELPRLADAVKIFPAISIIFPLKEDTAGQNTTEVAFGGGVMLANALAFSVATTTKDSPTAYFLVGLSVPDLVKSFTK